MSHCHLPRSGKRDADGKRSMNAYSGSKVCRVGGPGIAGLGFRVPVAWDSSLAFLGVALRVTSAPLVVQGNVWNAPVFVCRMSLGFQHDTLQNPY